ncbi:MAG: DNA polymerase domain-containing protein [Thermoplasmata archaeon]
MSERFRILAGSYSSLDDSVRIELFCRSEKGYSATLLYDGFRPYFHLVDPPEDMLDPLKYDQEIKGIKDVELWVDGSDRPCKKVICTYPWKVPNYRDRFSKTCDVLAADIPFVQRFLYDLDLPSTVTIEGEEVEDEKYLTKRIFKVNKFKPAEPFKPDLSYLSFDLENSLDDDTIYTICAVVYDGKERKKRCFDGDEINILRRFQKFVLDEDPDVITGYNINGYDLPVIIERAKHCGMETPCFGRDGSELRSVGNRMWRSTGRVIADTWWAVRSELNLKRETLNDAALEVLGEEKMDVDPLEMDSEWAENPEKVKEYCLKDAELALDILLELGVLDKAMDMATVSRLPVDEGLNGRTSTLVDSILIREADKKKIGVPLTHHGGKRGKIKGGYVHTIEPGLYYWVSVLDFKSMYPSIIMENNICFTTLSEDGEISSPTGDRFLSKDQREGLLSNILSSLMDERDEVKEKMRQASGKDKSYYDGVQKAIKILMNSFYGVFASSFYRFTDPRIGESITAFARKNIKKVIDDLESEGTKVIYSDTDSVFFQSTEENLEGTIALSKRIADEQSQGDIVLEFEKVLNPLFSHGRKKRYVARVVWPEEDMLVRGYELRRSDSFVAQNQSLENVFNHILDGDIDGALEIARRWVDRVRNGDIEKEKLVISRSCKKFDSYVNPDSMPNVQAARKMKEKGYRFIPGMKVSWIVTDASRTPQEVEPWLSDTEDTIEPDYRYYAQRVALTLSRVTEVFGWDEKGLLMGNKQSNLFSPRFDDNDQKEDKKQKPRKEKKDLTLQDFM